MVTCVASGMATIVVPAGMPEAAETVEPTSRTLVGEPAPGRVRVVDPLVHVVLLVNVCSVPPELSVCSVPDKVVLGATVQVSLVTLPALFESTLSVTSRATALLGPLLVTTIV